MVSAPADIDSINHVGMVVRDLAAATRRFEALGFQLTPYSPHSGAWKPGEPVQRMGSGNRCVMFGRNYLEILASEDPAAPAARIEAFLSRHEGAHIICFNSEAPGQVAARLAAAGMETSGVIPLQRDIDTPDGVRTAKFERVQFAPGDSPEGYIQAARHLTPEYIYQPRYVVHPNGCDALVEAFVVVSDPEGFARKYERYTGITPRRKASTWRFDFSLLGHLTIVSQRDAAAVLPGTTFPPLPAIAAVAFRTPDLAGQRARLAAAGIAFRETGARLLVPAGEACGVAVMFEA
jgi:catechol 2,3-dioxygenase-like lactoylglutathione lyase family enzyme